MRKVLLISILLTAMALIFPANKLYASILLDFEMSRDASPGDYDHTVFTPEGGKISFNGRVWHKIQNEAIKDHTLGTNQGSFLKNTEDKKKITIDFDFDVDEFEAWLVVYEGESNSVTAKVFDVDGNKMGKKEIGPANNWEKWKKKLDISGTPEPIRQLTLLGSSGNIFGIDDIKISYRSTEPGSEPEPIPEPASLILLGMGLLGAGWLGRNAAKK